MLAAVNWQMVKEMPEPRPAAGEVLVQVEVCGICGSDLHNVGRQFTSEQIPGHEFSGVILEVGPGVTDWAPGDKVVVNPQIYCGECQYCRAGDTNLCSGKHGVIGFQSNGGFAERVAVPAYTLLPVPAGMSFAIATLADPVAVDLHALKLVDLDDVRTAVVFGLGGIGFPLAHLLQSKCTVFAVDVIPRKLELARQGGLTVIDAKQEDVLKRFSGQEIDLCVDAVGEQSPTFNQALKLLKKRGVLLSVAQRNRFEMDYGPLGFKELAVRGVFAHTPRDFAEALQILAQAPWAQAMITSSYQLKDFNQAMAAAASGGELKVVVHCRK